jgi:hypothetical protein
MAALLLGGCTTLGPQSLQQTRLAYNEAVKATTEEQLLLNIVRLRYGDTPSSLSVSSIAAQWERSQSLQITPFFTSAGADVNRSYTAILPQASIAGADRPTVSLTPLDDQEFTRKLFTPLTLDGLVYLAKTTWPISTVFRLYLENLNWVSNAQTASGPTPNEPPEVEEFLRGIEAMQKLQDENLIVFGQDERPEAIGPPMPAAKVKPRDVLEAAKAGFDYQADQKAGTLTLVKKNQQPVLRVDPRATMFPEMREFLRVFRLKPGELQYDVTQEALNPFPVTYSEQGVTKLDVETRSLLQALYYISHGIEIPPEHAAKGFATITRDVSGTPYDWSLMTRGLFKVKWAAGEERPPQAHVATRYLDYWFYIDRSDQDTKSTFSLLMELSRLEVAGKGGPGPVLTIPVSGK